MRRDLTDAFLRALTPPASGRLEIRDARVIGLVLRLTAEGRATWSIRTRTRDGKQTRPTIGTWPAMGIAEARRTAQARLVEVQRGGDPVAEAQAARSARKAKAAEQSVADRIQEWIRARERDRVKPLAHTTVAQYRSMLTNEVVPKLGKLPLRDTTREQWAGIVAAKRRGAPATAALLYRTISSFLSYAEAHGWIPIHLLPRKGAATLAPAVSSRSRVLTDSELQAIWRAADRQGPKPRAFVHLLILTTARRTEVADIATGEVDLASGHWTIPKERAKNGQAITLPLSDLALVALRAVWPEHGERAGTGWRLLGRIRGSGFQGWSKLKQRIDAASGVTGWRWHDLRRTARTGMARIGVPREHAELAINHISGRTKLERTYDRHDYGPEILAAVGRWQAHLAGLVAPQPSAEVVPLASRKPPRKA
ncbi:integrase arm-type DNA-binding domain-containing protein [Roseomonas sp. NAR14]|uniref:Integrase arm-type DNA-binding domain-containing protein n=1 Tax=Roseomonas acroporae TaxID=2937791 RepID=A0A9X1YIE0_9PROT|nr:integrase arm-type DNA-binding domain-containing protein [Roseomonas acroporae]MCK8786766.1 integrase arm-type DNA-binding domain-containing protein [Roseomonas acroporae]